MENSKMNEQIARIVDEYSDMLYRLAFVRTGNWEDAGDIVQQTFLRLVEHYGDLDTEAHVKAWLIRVCLNQCNNLYRNPWRSRRTMPGDSEHPNQWETMQEERQEWSPEESVCREFLRKALWKEVFSLPGKYRVVLHLHYMEEYSLTEIADILHVRYNTVCVRLNRAKKILGERLDKEEFDYE